MVTAIITAGNIRIRDMLAHHLSTTDLQVKLASPKRFLIKGIPRSLEPELVIKLLGHNCEPYRLVKLCFLKRNRKESLYNLAFDTNSTKIRILVEDGNHLPLGAYNLFCEEIPIITQCFQCFKLGHKSTNCTNLPCCGHCAGNNHLSRECPQKNDIKSLYCVNCPENHNNHSSLSKECHQKLYIQSKLNYYDH